MATKNDVQRYRDVSKPSLKTLLARYQLDIVEVEPNESIAGSFWGDEEAGLLGNQLYVRDDTPLHSILHEAGHYICMDPERRDHLDTNAGGDYDEENAVCYLQILLAEQLPDSSAARAQEDMNRWGYSFRLGSAQRWFAQDAEDAKAWLMDRGLIAESGGRGSLTPSWRLNTSR